MEVRNRSSVKTNLILRRTVRRTAKTRAAPSTRRKGYLNNLPLVCLECTRTGPLTHRGACTYPSARLACRFGSTVCPQGFSRLRGKSLSLGQAALIHLFNI